MPTTYDITFWAFNKQIWLTAIHSSQVLHHGGYHMADLVNKHVYKGYVKHVTQLKQPGADSYMMYGRSGRVP